MQAETPIERAIRLAGGPAALAKQLGESTNTVVNWRARGAAPANHCAAIQRITGVDRRELRPKDWRDYWPELDGAPALESRAAARGELQSQSEADHATCGAAQHPNTPRGTGRDPRHERRHGPCDPREGY